MLETVMKYQIVADAKQAKAELSDLDKIINKTLGHSGASQLQQGFKNAASEASNLVSIFTGNKLTGITSQLTSFGGALGAIPGPAGLAVGAVAGFGAVAAAAGAALYELSKSASEYGSVIHDTSQKTGLGAETISSLKIAADQSSSSIEAISGGLAKFAKTVGAAGDGSKEAAAKIKAFGIDPQAALNDLDGALGKVFAKIAAARPGIEQTTLAQKAFGKSGAELIPTIVSFDGNLPALIAHMKELGLTMSDADAAAADEFGDQMDTLKTQIAAAGRTIGFEFMPIFREMATEIQQWLVENKDDIRSWGQYSADIIRGVAAYWNDATTAIQRYKAESRSFGQSPFGSGSAPASGGDVGYLGAIFPHVGLLSYLLSSAASRGADARGTGVYGPYSWEMSKPTPKDFGPKDGGKSGKDIFKLSPQGQALVDAATKLGIKPLDLATIIGFETAGTYSTSITNQVGRFGLLQFGKSEATAYGAKKGESFESQVTGAVVRYLQDRFARAGRSTEGSSILDLYRTVLGGSPTASLTGKDVNGTSPLSGVARMLRDNQPAALRRFFGGTEANANKAVPSWLAEYNKAKTQADADEKERIKNAEAAAKREVAISKTASDEIVKNLQREYEAAIRLYDPEQATTMSEALHGIRMREIGDEIKALEDKYRRAVDGSEEQKEALAELQTATLQLAEKEKQADEARIARQDAIQAIYEQQIRWELTLKKIEQDRLDMLNEIYKLATVTPPGYGPDGKPNAIAPGGTGLESGRGTDLFGPDGISKIKSQSDIYLGVVNDMKSMANEAFASMAHGVGSMVEQWVLYGDAGPNALRKMTASILANLAAQAAVEAIMETARGFAALARYDFASAGHHFVSAGIFAGIGLGAAVAGRAVAGDSFKNASASGGGYGSSVPVSNSPFSRSTSNAYSSGRDHPAIHALTQTVQNLDAKISSMRPGQVLTTAANENPGIFAEHTIRDVENNSSHGTRLLRASGYR